MKDLSLQEAFTRSMAIRESYHKLERQLHEKEWTVEEDALAFLTDAGLVGRLTMATEARWPVQGDASEQLEHKLGECLWWLLVLAGRSNVDAVEALDKFLTKTEKLME